MTFLDIVAAERKKLTSLPSTRVALAISFFATPSLAALTSNSLRSALDSGNLDRFINTSPIEAGFAAIPTIGVLGPIILGVAIISSEYTPSSSDGGGGRQIVATLASIPNRLVLLAAKLLVLGLFAAAGVVVTIPATMALSQAVLGEHGLPLTTVFAALGWRAFGVGAYWILTALSACAITVLTRNGIVPLIVLITNSSLVSISLQMSRVTPLGKYLPDVAGAQMFTVDYPAENMLDPVAGGVVMVAWTLALLVVAAIVLARRDA